jgi:CopG family transcriptional regulator/antitoxin EndoAI
MPAVVERRAAKSVKVAVDFPDPLFRETEQAAQELSTNRSSLIRSAVELFLRQRRRQKLEDAIAESFLANRDLDQQLVDEFKHVDADADLSI